MKIAQVSKYFHPHKGGIESHVLGISEEFTRRGHSVVVFASNDPKAPKEEMYTGIRIVRSSVWFTLFNGPFTPGMVLKLFREDYDVLHIHLPDPANSLFALIAAKIKRKPFYVTYHADIIKDSWYQKPFVYAYGLILNLVLGGAKQIIATTPDYVAKSQIPDRYREKIVIAPNFVDAKRFNPGIEGSRIRNEFSLQNKKVVFFLGRLVPYKGVEYIISAFREVKKEIPEAVLIIAGRGPLEDELKMRAVDEKVEDVLFLQPEDDKIPEYYAACDIYVMPSVTRQEAFGIALLEAMSCGKPTITTNISGMPYVVGDAGLKVDIANIEQLSQAMIKLLLDDELRKELGEKGRKRVMEEFTVEGVADKLLELYKD
jgi:glycosyltransferase involved in cell wall biosynthesis